MAINVEAHKRSLRTITEAEWQAVAAATAALIDSDDEVTLLQAICTAAAETGGYRLVVYMRVPEERVGAMQMLASHGPAKPMLDSFVATLGDDAPTSRGVGAEAITSSRTIVVPDVMVDPRTVPWRHFGPEYGIKSMTASPVTVNGQVDGVLVLYAGTVDAFDDVSVAIVESLCRHIGAGLARHAVTRQVKTALTGTVQVLVTTLEARDPYTAGHQVHVGGLAAAIAVRLSVSEPTVEVVRLAGLVHDIGKIGIPDSLLTKPTPLRATEMALIRDHAVLGEEILATVTLPWPISTIVGQHHERLDGSGYPRGLAGDEVVLEARIIAVADVLDAMTLTRPYRIAHSMDDAFQYLTEFSRSQYDYDVVEAARSLMYAEDGSPLSVDTYDTVTLRV